MSFPCPRCSQPTAPIWAQYDAQCRYAGTDGAAQLRLPMHRCASGHVEGWRADDDFLADLAMGRFTYSPELEVGTVRPDRRAFGRTRCGNCAKKLELRTTGVRLAGTVTVALPDVGSHAEFHLELLEAVCTTCGARPSPSHTSTVEIPSDVNAWIFQLLAAAVPTDNTVHEEPRT